MPLNISLKEDVQPVVTFFQSKGLNKLIDYVPKEALSFGKFKKSGFSSQWNES
ncbi:hypothetical protein [Carnobacterium maltaromaticum]|uniref:hypothetical protein n=1 Tax=Carnobacterium maltaromaticum TaxID=2751 RepID=UPI0039BE6722